MKKLSILVVIVMIASWSVIHAQDPSISSEPTDTPKRYLLEIYITPQLGPRYFAVNGPKERTSSMYFPRFIPTDAQPETGRPPIRAVKMVPHFNGESADVKVTVLRGIDGYEEEDPVHVYQLTVGEQKSLTHLRQLGIEPFRMRLLDATLPLPPEPDFKNFTRSIEIVKVSREHTPVPAYRIRLRNVSDKSVSALKVDVTSHGQEGPITLPDGPEGRSLMDPGGLIDVYIPVVVAVLKGGTYVPGTLDSHTINIRSVSFTDLTFEGEVDRACSHEAQLIGKRLWLNSMIAFIDQELSTSNFDNQIETAKQFNEKLSKIRQRLDENERNQTSTVSPSCPKPAKEATLTARGMNLILLREVDQFISNAPAPPTTFKSWLEEKRAGYAAWLSRL